MWEVLWTGSRMFEPLIIFNYSRASYNGQDIFVATVQRSILLRLLETSLQQPRLHNGQLILPQGVRYGDFLAFFPSYLIHYVCN